MNSEIPKSPERINTSFERSSIQIVGAKEQGEDIYEADVRFSDLYGNEWYLTITTADQNVKETFSEFEQSEPTDFDAGNDLPQEPKKLVWNGELNDDVIQELIMRSGMDLLRPYLIPYVVDNEAE